MIHNNLNRVFNFALFLGELLLNYKVGKKKILFFSHAREKSSKNNFAEIKLA